MTHRMDMNDAMDEVFNRRHAARGLDDSDRNILADLAHEADEPCAVCGDPVSMSPCNPPGTWKWDFTLDADGEQPCHEDCYDDAREAHLEQQAEARADRRSS